MKKLTFSSLFLVACLLLSAQIQKPDNEPHPNIDYLSGESNFRMEDHLKMIQAHLPEHAFNEKSAQNVQIVLDSILDFTYSSPADSTPLTRRIFQYNDAGQFETLNYYSWDGTSNTWENSQFIEYTYNDNGDFILVILYTWNAVTEEWIASSKSEYDYDDMGNITLLAVYFWDINMNMWIGNFKAESEYDANGKNIMEIQYAWDNDSNDWIYNLLYENVYDLNGYIIETGKSVWIDEQWIPDYKVVYENNMNGTPDSSFYYNWNAGEWEVYIKTLFTYNDQNLLIQTINYLWISNSYWTPNSKQEIEYDDNGNRTLDAYFAWNGFGWDGIQKTEHEYDENGYEILYIYSVWDNLGMDWVYYSRFEQENTATGQLIWFDYSKWNTDAGEWEYVSREEYTYTLEEFQSSIALFFWDMESSNWVIDSKTYMYYSELSVGIREYMVAIPEILPNPFAYATTIQFSLRQSSHVTLTLHNLQGSKVMEVIDQQLAAGQHQVLVDGSGLGDGFYFGILKTDAGTISLKLIKQ